jgi:hypothetical protein
MKARTIVPDGTASGSYLRRNAVALMPVVEALAAVLADAEPLSEEMVALDAAQQSANIEFTMKRLREPIEGGGGENPRS